MDALAQLKQILLKALPAIDAVRSVNDSRELKIQLNRLENEIITVNRSISPISCFSDAELIKCTLEKCLQEKGYAIEFEDAIKILEELEADVSTANDWRWKKYLRTIDTKCSTVNDPSNIFYIYKELGLLAPKWYAEKYSHYKLD